MDYDPSTGQAKAPRRGLNKSRRGFSRSKAKRPSNAQWGRLRFELGPECTQIGAENFARMANGYFMGELMSLHLMIAINHAQSGDGPYGTTEELLDVACGGEWPEPKPHLMVRMFKRAGRRKGQSEGTASSSLSLEQIRARAISVSTGKPRSSKEPSLNASRLAKSMTTLELLKKRRLRLSAISATNTEDGPDNLDGATVDNSATEKSTD